MDELQGLVEELEAQLKEVRAASRAKDGQLEEQKHRERELLATVTRYIHTHTHTSLCTIMSQEHHFFQICVENEAFRHQDF